MVQFCSIARLSVPAISHGGFPLFFELHSTTLSCFIIFELPLALDSNTPVSPRPLHSNSKIPECLHDLPYPSAHIRRRTVPIHTMAPSRDSPPHLAHTLPRPGRTTSTPGPSTSSFRNCLPSQAAFHYAIDRTGCDRFGTECRWLCVE